MSIPLIQKPEKDDINTSIIAIKRNIERINMLLGLSNSEEIDTSEFVKKSDIVDVVEADNMNPVTSNAVVPVDEVTLGNMQSVSSNAVAEAISFSTAEHQVGYWTDGKPLYEITAFLRVPANGNYTISTPSGIKIRDWRGNFYQRSIDNPSWIMHIPYTYIDMDNNRFLNIYVFYNGGDSMFYVSFEGTYASSYYNGYARITYKYTKNSD